MVHESFDYQYQLNHVDENGKPYQGYRGAGPFFTGTPISQITTSIPLYDDDTLHFPFSVPNLGGSPGIVNRLCKIQSVEFVSETLKKSGVPFFRKHVYVTNAILNIELVPDSNSDLEQRL